MRLSHLHLPNPISYAQSLRLQEAVLERQFAYNTSRLQARSSPSTISLSPPSPIFLTFQTTPTYTVGRRHLKSNPLSDSQIQFLTSQDLASFHLSPRGGLLTYHAPGQLTGYLICNLRYHDITPRCHIRLLEEGVIRTAEQYGVGSGTTEDPGVWAKNPDGQVSDRKICAIGVHVTRGITSHGVGLNVTDQRIEHQRREMYKLSIARGAEQYMEESDRLAEGYLSWGFSRIVACGLEGKSVTWLTEEGAKSDTEMSTVAEVLAREMCKGLHEKGKIAMEGVDNISEIDILESGTTNTLPGQNVEDMKGGLDDWIGILKGGEMINDQTIKR